MPDNADIIDEILKPGKSFAPSVLQYPFVKLVFPLALGIFAAYYSEITVSSAIILVGFVVTAIALGVPKFNKHVKAAILYVFLFLTGIFSLGSKLHKIPKLPAGQTGYLLLALDEPKLGDKTVSLPVKILAFKDSRDWQTLEQAKGLVYIKRNSISEKIVYGDSLLVFTEFRRVRNLGNPFEFDYAGYLARKGIYHSAFVDSTAFKITGHKGGNKVLLLSHTARNRLLNTYKKYGLPDSLFGVAAALTLGYRQALDRDTRQSFARTGAMHVLAVSGLHVGVLFIVLLFLLKPVFSGKWRWLAAVIIILVLWGFAFITGLSPSVRRSAFMFSLITLGRTTKRQANIYNSLAASAFFMLLFFPFDLFDAGFWLSYSAVLSIVYFQPMIYSWFYFKQKILDWIWNLISVSVAAQLGTMPIGLYLFNQFPNYFILTNLVAIPLASIILYSAMLVFVFSFIPVIAQLFMFIFSLSVKILYLSVKTIESLPLAYTSHVYINLVQMLLIYGIIFSVVAFFRLKNKKAALAALALALTFITIGKITSYKLTHPQRIIIYNIPKINAISIVQPGQITLLADSGLIDNTGLLERYFYPYWVRAGVENRVLIYIDNLSNYQSENITAKNYFFSATGKTFFLSKSSKIYDSLANNRLSIDYIILANNVYVAMRDLAWLFDYKYVIFSSSDKQFKTQHWKAQADSTGVNYFDANNGAIVITENSTKYWSE